MDLLKQAVTLLEGPVPTTVADVISVLNKELKGKTVTAYGKAGKGLWGKNDEEQTFTITKVSSTYHDRDDAEKGGNVFVSVDITLKGYKAEKHGLIYTDRNFEKSLKALIKATTVGKLVSDLDYSEQGMQGSSYVNFDATFKLPKVKK